MNKHVNSYKFNIFKKIEEINGPLKEEEKQPSIKKPNMSSNSISNFFATKEKKI